MKMRKGGEGKKEKKNVVLLISMSNSKGEKIERVFIKTLNFSVKN